MRIAPEGYFDMSIIHNDIIPKLLQIIEESGINCDDAVRIPHFLEQAIKSCNRYNALATPFLVNPNVPESHGLLPSL